MESTDNFKKSYSQFGEDLIIGSIFNCLFQIGMTNIKYVDIGANYPISDNNTFAFYQQGGSGILVEPNPYFLPFYKLDRPNDIVFNAGIRYESGLESAQYYDFGYEAHGLNTFSEKRKEEVIKRHKLVKTHIIPLIDINEVFSHMEYIDFVSMDIEGFELPILKTLDFNNNAFRPKLFCIEANKSEIECGHNSDLVEYLRSKDYVLVADNFVNQFFVDIKQLRPHEVFDLSHNGIKW